MGRKRDSCMVGIAIFCGIASLALWGLLIVLKATGAIGAHWNVVLSGIVWITWTVYGTAAVCMFIICAFLHLLSLLLRWLASLKRWFRRRKNDRRIIAQAKAVGVWGKPWCLGGRALELAAWEYCKIKRKPGETDKELMQRCMEEADNEYAANIAKVYSNETIRYTPRNCDGRRAKITLVDELHGEKKEEETRHE